MEMNRTDQNVEYKIQRIIFKEQFRLKKKKSGTLNAALSIQLFLGR